MRAACALVLSATLLTAAGGAAAQTTRWSTPVDLAPAAANAGSPRIGVDARGDAVIVWRRGDGTWESLTRTRAGRLTSRRTLPPGTLVAAPRLVVGPRGDAVVLGKSPAALLRPGRQWQTLEPPGPPVAADAVPVDAGFDARGRMTVQWRQGEALFVALLRVDGTWTRPRLLARRDLSHGFATPDARVVTNARGDAVVVWTDEWPLPGAEARKGLLAARRPSRGRFGRPVRLLAPAETLWGFWANVDGRGRVEVMWLRSRSWGDPAGAWQVLGRTWGPRSGRPGPIRTLTAPFGTAAEPPQIRFAPSGGAMLVDSARGRVHAAVRERGRRFGATQALVAGEGTVHGALGEIDASGRAVVVWARSVEDRIAVESAVRRPGGGFGPREALGDAGPDCPFAPRVACARGGIGAMALGGRSALAVWQFRGEATRPGQMPQNPEATLAVLRLSTSRLPDPGGRVLARR